MYTVCYFRKPLKKVNGEKWMPEIEELYCTGEYLNMLILSWMWLVMIRSWNMVPIQNRSFKKHFFGYSSNILLHDIIDEKSVALICVFLHALVLHWWIFNKNSIFLPDWQTWCRSMRKNWQPLSLLTQELCTLWPWRLMWECLYRPSDTLLVGAIRYM